MPHLQGLTTARFILLLACLLAPPGPAWAYGEAEVDYVNVRDYGAVGDGQTDDTQSIQDAIDAAEAAIVTSVRRHVYFPPGVYRVTDALVNPTGTPRQTGVLTLRASGMALFSGGAHDALDSAQAVIRLDSVAKLGAPMIDMGGHIQGIQGLVLQGPGKLSSQVAIRFKKLNPNTDDVDGTVTSTKISQFGTAVQIIGRGLRFRDNKLASCTHGVDVSWPDCRGECIGNQGPEHGLRAFQIQDNRAHNVSIFMLNEGINAHNLKGLVFSGNQSDLGNRLFQGGAQQSSFTGNVVVNTKYPAFDFTYPARRITISGNTIAGKAGWPDTDISEPSATDPEPEKVPLSEDQPAFGIRCQKDCEYMAITGNAFSYINASAIRFEGPTKFVTITGNTFSEVVNETMALEDDAGIYFAQKSWRISIVGNAFFMNQSDFDDENTSRSGNLFAIRAPKVLEYSHVQANTVSHDMAGVIPAADYANSSVQPPLFGEIE
ncbi:MAG: glycosyl hydrolase family 28-related protein [Myxococcota bacterium]